MTTGAGAAREISPGRLADFENTGESDTFSSPMLPPRRPAADAGTPEAPTRPELPARQRSTTKKAAERPSRRPEEPAAPREAAKPSAAPEKGTKGPGDRVRPSNVHIPVALLDPLVAKCKAEGLSHGEVIIIAIEETHPRLKDLIHPAATAGGGLFASRRSRAARNSDGPLTPLNYRLRETDFATLDQLVDEFGASSRGHLITAALTEYLNDN